MSSPSPAHPDGTELLEAGLLRGRPLELDPATFRRLADADYSTQLVSARWIAALSSPSWGGGEAGLVAIKSIEDDCDGRRRPPRNLRREIHILATLNHPNVRLTFAHTMLTARLTTLSLSTDHRAALCRADPSRSAHELHLQDTHTALPSHPLTPAPEPFVHLQQ